MKRDRRRPLAMSRILLVLVGVLLTAVAAVGGLLATGIVNRLTSYTDADESVLSDQAREQLADHAGAFQAGAAAVGVALVAVGLVWLSRQVPPPRQRDDVELDLAAAGDAGSPAPGETRVAGSALAEALEEDLVSRAAGVHGARVDYRHHRDRRPDELRLRLDVDPSLPAADLVAGPVASAVDRFATVAGLDQRPSVLTDLRLATPEGRRVV